MSWSAAKITAVLVVPSVEASLAFWEGRLGFTKVVDVPHGEGLGFAILVKDGTEVMLQSEASVKDDVGSVIAGSSTALFIEVSDLDAVIASLGDTPVVVPRRTTFYGMHEIGVREPGGHLVVFAQPTGQ